MADDAALVVTGADGTLASVTDAELLALAAALRRLRDEGARPDEDKSDKGEGTSRA